MPKKRAATKTVHPPFQAPSDLNLLAQSPVFASTYPLAGDPTPSNPYQYGRFGNPSWQALETQIGELEEGHCVLFPSGMAAISAVLMALTQQGDTIIVPGDGYEPTLAFARQYLSKYGITVKPVPILELLDTPFDGVRLVLCENPSNPMLDQIDIELLANKVHQANCLLVVDNTVATPLGQKPLTLGADLVLASGSKALNGHSDTLMGYVTTPCSNLISEIRTWRKLSGAIPGPMEAFLVQRGLATLAMRLDTMCRNAQRIANHLNELTKPPKAIINWVRYPGLDHDPASALAQKQMQNTGFLITFEMGSEHAARRFLGACKLITEATSFGGLHSMAERRARWQPSLLSAATIRLSVGCEHVDDLLDDIDQALATLD